MIGIYNLWEILTRPDEIAAHLAVAVCCALFCLIDVWSGESRRHWFVRVVGVVSALAIFLPIRAYDALLLMAVTMSMLALGWGAVAWRNERREVMSSTHSTRWRPRIQYRLHDLLLAMVVVGVVVWAARKIAVDGVHIREWWRLPLHAALLAVAASAAVMLTRTQWKLRAAAVLAVLILAAAELEFWVLQDWMDPYWVYRTVAVLVVDYALFAAACGGIDRLSNAWRRPWSASREQRLARWTTAAGGLAFLSVCGWICGHMVNVSWGPVPASSGKNVYPQVFELAVALRTAAPAQAAAIRAQLLELLEQPGRSVLDWDAARRDPLGQNEVSRFRPPRHAARELNAECDRLQAAGDHDQATDIAIAILRLGEMAAREGSILDVQVGLAIESVGDKELAESRSAISTQKRRELLRTLAEHQQRREPLHVVVDRTERWGLWTEGWRYRLASVQQRLWQHGPSQRFEYSNLRRGREAAQRLLIVDLAIRNFRDDHGSWPSSLFTLVPANLPELPLDPWSKKSFVYRAIEPEFVLYSVGWDGEDNGGKLSGSTVYHNSAASREAGWDLSLDTLTRP